jgi:hypothetical protein
MTREELKRQVRYAISQLSSDNGDKTFEHLCRAFTRRRICPNVLPATGPVQSGGDQGRDFETYKSGIAGTVSDVSYAGMTKQNIAFACSLEQNPTRKNGKIDSDVKSIMQHGERPQLIIFFSGQDIPVAKRHKKQAEIKSNHNVEIEIFDANAISEQLTEEDTFYIAVEYLKISNDLFPIFTQNTYYNDLRRQFSSINFPKTVENFCLIKNALRHIYKDKGLKADISFWQERIDIFIKEYYIEPIKRDAIYEKFVTSFVGLRSAKGQESNVYEYFEKLELYDDSDSLKNATILISFAYQSLVSGDCDFSKDGLDSIFDRISKALQTQYIKCTNNDKKCVIVEAQAHHEVSLIYRNNESISKGISNAFITKMLELENLLPNTHYYPIESLSDNINKYIKIFKDLEIDISGLERLTKVIDDVYQKRLGDFALAERLRDRAILYMEENDHIKAISLLHKVAILWFNKDLIKGSILALILLTRCYHALKMHYAAKYYALAASHIAVNAPDKELISYYPKAIRIAADCDYVTGAWIGYLDLLQYEIASILSISEQDFDKIVEDDLSIIFHPSIIKYYASIFNPDIIYLINAKLNILNDWTEVVDKNIETQKSAFQSEEALWDNVISQMDGRPFNDIGKDRCIEFEIYGSVWKIRFENNRITTSISEQFASAVQIFAVEMIERELYLIKSPVNIQVAHNDNAPPSIKYELNNNSQEWEWRLTFPANDETKKGEQNDYALLLASFLIEIFKVNSLLPSSEFEDIIKDVLSNNFLTKISFGNYYEAIFKNLISAEMFDSSCRSAFVNRTTQLKYHHTSVKELSWNDTIAPKYNYGEIIERIEKRAAFIDPIEISLPKLKDNPSFKNYIKQNRDNGLLDWQIQGNITSLIVNYKFNRLNVVKDDSIEVYMKKFNEYLFKKEGEWYLEIPIELFHRDDHKITFYTQTMSYLPAFGLENNTNHPNISSIIEFLNIRFNYNKDGQEMILFDL